MRITWADDATRYPGPPEDEELVVLAPSEPARRSAWQRVLDWYTAAGGAPPPVVPDDGHRLVATDPAWAAPARLFAQRTGRPLTLVDGPRAVADTVDPSTRTLLLFGPPGHFSAHHQRHLLGALPVPFGVATGVDLAGLSFLVAKLLLGRVTGGRPHATLDDIQARATVMDGKDGLRSMPVDGEMLTDLLSRREWDTFTLRAHSRGGHVTLAGGVLCGLVGERERDGTGAPREGGCRAEDGRYSCKLAAGRQGATFGIAGIRARDLFLFTCGGSLMPGDLFDADTSQALAALEAWPRAVVASPDLLTTGGWMPGAVLAATAAGFLPGGIVAMLNALRLRDGARSLILFGDPAAPDVPWRSLSPHGDVDVVAPAQLVLIDRSVQAGSVLTQDEPGRLAVGPAHAAVLFDAPWTGRLRLADRSDALAAARQLFSTAGRRLPRAERLERAIHARLADGGEEIREQLDGLAQVRRLLWEHVDAGLAGCEESLRQGVWLPTLPVREQVCRQLVGVWDVHMARLLLHLFPRDVAGLLLEGFAGRRTLGARSCEYCGSSAGITGYFAPLGDAGEATRTDCPTCGNLAAGPTEGPGVELALTPTAVPGSVAQVSVRVRPHSPGFAPAPVIALHGFEEGPDGATWRVTQVLDAPSAIFALPVPLRASPKLHPIQAAVVEGLQVSACRRMWPALPPTPSGSA